MRKYQLRIHLFVSCVLTLLTPLAPAAQETEARTDFLSFAQGALAVRVGGNPATRSTLEHAVQATDGADGGFAYTTLADPELPVEFVYELPALTTFDRFAVPNVFETPSPSQTFVREIEVQGSMVSPDEGFVTLASGSLSTHSDAGQYSELDIRESVPVRWIKLLLHGGIDVQRDQMFLEFSEIIGNGTQAIVAEPQQFAGGWRGRGVAMLLRQNGATVSGCYDGTGDLSGTVTGRILRATGIDRNDQTASAFIVLIADNGAMQGMRSTNGAPFRLFAGEPAADPASLRCAEPPPPTLGCGSVIHGIGFVFDSADITPESRLVIDSLLDGLLAESAASIRIEGHTSSEGSEQYNQNLSERRAQAVVDALVANGIESGLLSAAGLGESRPIASNEDESGRSLNRRVEVHCGAD